MKLQHLKCSCGERWSENIVGRDEYIPIQIVEKMFRHFRKKGHKPVIKRFDWPRKERSKKHSWVKQNKIVYGVSLLKCRRCGLTTYNRNIKQECVWRKRNGRD